MKSPTFQEIAEDWNLWIEYVDPDGVGTREEWERTPMSERIKFLESCFGPETSYGL